MDTNPDHVYIREAPPSGPRRVECSFPNCGRKRRVVSTGLCIGHYAQQRRGEELHPLRDYEYGNQSIRDMSEIEIAWIAGILEGEGYFTIHQGSAKIQLSMTDFDVIDKVRKLTGGCGSVSRKFDSRGGRKPVKRWELSGERARILMVRILPHMGERRSAKINGILDG